VGAARAVAAMAAELAAAALAQRRHPAEGEKVGTCASMALRGLPGARA
jgi:hypothetical protein